MTALPWKGEVIINQHRGLPQQEQNEEVSENGYLEEVSETALVGLAVTIHCQGDGQDKDECSLHVVFDK